MPRSETVRTVEEGIAAILLMYPPIRLTPEPTPISNATTQYDLSHLTQPSCNQVSCLLALDGVEEVRIEELSDHDGLVRYEVTTWDVATTVCVLTQINHPFDLIALERTTLFGPWRFTCDDLLQLRQLLWQIHSKLFDVRLYLRESPK